MNHDQTKKIFEDWSLFLKEAEKPSDTKLEKFEKDLIKLRQLAYDIDGQKDPTAAAIEIGRKLNQLKKTATTEDNYRATEDTPKFYTQLINEYEPAIMYYIDPAFLPTLGDELSGAAEQRRLRTQGPSIRAITDREAYGRAYKKFQGLPPKPYAPRRDLKDVIDTAAFFWQVIKPVDALDWGILILEIFVPELAMLGVLGDANRFNRAKKVLKLRNSKKLAKLARSARSSKKAAKYKRLGKRRQRSLKTNARRTMRKFAFLNTRSSKILRFIMMQSIALGVSFALWEEIEKDIRKELDLTSADELKRRQLEDYHENTQKAKEVIKDDLEGFTDIINRMEQAAANGDEEQVEKIINQYEQTTSSQQNNEEYGEPSD